ncbi:flagellar-hook associated protein 3 [Oceanobacillus iheyensis HTE831]|uniref:Flagellar-hook associated protein 3 n=1 Tax=Oceanobacillus iheyensis (strain DSM 14371 / CIP 107618 / JCM 11309 / KCTC 3954 / HTE831) TaxID=221109 RepID=Q8ENH7_OCEIH|nr:flagellar hook-associated protein FlgL [Oceanobacillus iheyensis]BAC14462.1 flagellar-hook associated protein 3 [Oceanobacillus iheyensis HTE831]
MRVTQSMLSNNMLRNLTNSNAQMNKYMEQLYTGKKITKPSDDPVVAMKGIGYRSELVRVEQYQRNTSEVNNWMDNSDSALDQATSAMQRLRELAVKANNGTNSEDELQSILQEANELKGHLTDIANTNVNGKYIFNGTNTDTPPVTVDEDGNITTEFQDSDVVIEVSAGTKIKANVDGGEAFGGDPDLFTAVDNFIDNLESGENLDESIGELDTGINQIINSRAELGARMNRLELIENRLSEQEIVATQTMSDNEDADYAETITKLITQESLHRAALSAGSRIIQPSLLDFLR